MLFSIFILFYDKLTTKIKTKPNQKSIIERKYVQF
jgi:hypothetical protein